MECMSVCIHKREQWKLCWKKSLLPLFAMVGSHKGGEMVGKEDSRMPCCFAIKACSKQIMWKAQSEHCSVSPRV
jgi:hypothetical protein